MNQAMRKEEEKKNPHLQRRLKAERELQDFYQKHPHVSKHVAEEVMKLRTQCEADVKMLSKKADDDITRTEAIFMEKELALISGYDFTPDAEPKSRSSLLNLFARRI